MVGVCSCGYETCARGGLSGRPLLDRAGRDRGRVVVPAKVEAPVRADRKFATAMCVETRYPRRIVCRICSWCGFLPLT